MGSGGIEKILYTEDNIIGAVQNADALLPNTKGVIFFYQTLYEFIGIVR